MPEPPPDVHRAVATIIRDTHGSAAAVAGACRLGGWADMAAGHALAHVRGLVAAELTALEREQIQLQVARNRANLKDLAREHALRGRAHARGRDQIRQLLEAQPGEPLVGPLVYAAMAALEHLEFLAPHVAGAGTAALELRRFMRGDPV